MGSESPSVKELTIADIFVLVSERRQCVFCPASYSMKTSSGILYGHAEREHDTEWKNLLRTKLLTQPTQPSIKDYITAKDSTSHYKDAFRDCIAKWIVGCNIPFNVLDSGLFKDVVKMASRRGAYLALPSTFQVRTAGIQSLDTEAKVKREIILNSAISISITADGYSAENNRVQIYAVVAHALLPNFSQERILLCASNVAGQPHTSDLLTQITKDSLGANCKKVVGMTTDGASNQKKCSLDITPNWTHCGAHVINLVVQSALKHIETDLCEVRRFAKALRRSSANKREFEEALAKKDRKGHQVPLDCRTRWNSTFLMLSEFLKVYDVAVTCSFAPVLSNSFLQNSTIIEEMLSHAKEATELLSSNKASIAIYLPIMLALSKGFNRSDEQRARMSTDCRKFADELKLGIDSRIEDVKSKCPLIGFAMLLDPRIGFNKDFATASEWESQVEKLLEFAEEHKDSLETDNEKSTDIVLEEEELTKSRTTLLGLICSNKPRTTVSATRSIEREMNEYRYLVKNTVFADFQSLPYFAASFWMCKRGSLKTLSRVALMVLNVPSTSVVVERLFSDLSWIRSNKRRNNIKSENLECLLNILTEIRNSKATDQNTELFDLQTAIAASQQVSDYESDGEVDVVDDDDQSLT